MNYKNMSCNIYKGGIQKMYISGKLLDCSTAFHKLCDEISKGIHTEYNNYNYENGAVWYEDESGVKWQSKSEMRDYKIRELGI